MNPISYGDRIRRKESRRTTGILRPETDDQIQKRWWADHMTRQDPDDAGYDSFLDIVSNMVGILIVLVMVAGIRAGNAPLPELSEGSPATTDSPETVAIPEGNGSPESFTSSPPPPQNPPPELHDLAEVTKENEEIVSRLASLEKTITERRQELARRDQESSRTLARQTEIQRHRAIQSTELTGLQEKTSEIRAQLVRSHQDQTQLQRTLYERRVERKELESQLSKSESERETKSTKTVVTAEVPESASPSATPPVKTLESYPTPVSRVVSGPELHYQLRGNRVVHVPVDALTRLVVEDARSQIHRLSDRLVPLDHFNSGDNRAMGEIGATVGPVEGFRMRYLLRRVSRPGVGAGVELAGWTVIPVSGVQGETPEEMFRTDSAFLRSLDGIPPDGSTLTFWVSGDSFESFHAIRKWAHEQGWSVAGRPLPDGFPISGSPEGAQSEAM
ncbi:MAG: hypothetical protein Q4C47_01125 [Planctomycetia bacterium]|nr:hypothetical protein [Planctomycetia bacterium]